MHVVLVYKPEKDINMYPYINTHALIYSHLQKRHIHKPLCTYTHICIDTPTHMYVYVHTYVYTHIRTCIHIRKHTHINTLTNMHTRNYDNVCCVLNIHTRINMHNSIMFVCECVWLSMHVYVYTRMIIRSNNNNNLKQTSAHKMYIP